MDRAGIRWVALVAAVLVFACQEEEDVFTPEPGDANAGALALLLEGKVFAAPQDEVAELSAGDGLRPTPDPTPTPSVPDRVTLAIFSDCRTGEACLSYGVYEPDTGRKEFVTATCSFSAFMDGYAGECYTFDQFEWDEFGTVEVEVLESETVVNIELEGQDKVTFTEAPYVVSGSSDCVAFEHAPSPPPHIDD